MGVSVELLADSKDGKDIPGSKLKLREGNIYVRTTGTKEYHDEHGEGLYAFWGRARELLAKELFPSEDQT